MPTTRRKSSSIAFLSGLGSLALELSLFKLFAVRLGTSTGSVALVLSGFMGGMALGYAFFGRSRGRLTGGAPGLALFQIFAAALSILLPLLSGLMGAAFRGSFWIAGTTAFAAAAVGAFPSASAVPLLFLHLKPKNHDRRAALGRLYGWNTAGGVAGALLAPFFVLPRFGLTACFGFAALSFLAAAAVALALPRQAHPAPQKVRKTPVGDKERASAPVFVLSLAALCGFSGLALETVWERILAVFLPNRSTSFGIVLAVYLGAYAAGSLWASRESGTKGKVSCGRLFFFLCSLPALAHLALPLTALLPGLLFQAREFLIQPWRQVFLPPALLAIGLVAPPAFCMGALLPHLAALLPSRGLGEDSDIGWFLGANALGSVLGALAPVFLLFPALGALRTGLVTALGYAVAAAALVLWRGHRGGMPRSRLAWPALSAVCCLVFLLMPGFVPRPLPVSVLREPTRRDRVLYYAESRDGTVAVVEDALRGVRTAYVNNSMVCGTTFDALKTVRVLAHLPMLVHPRPERVLVIGFGMGVTAGNVLSYPVERVDCVELCPEIRGAAPLFEPYNRSPLKDGRLRFHGGDGRAWLLREGGVYDVVTCDPTHPALGSGNLYTREFFELVRGHLARDGVFVQYCPLRYITPGGLKSLVATMKSVFPDCSLWLTASHAVLMGTMGPLEVVPGTWAARLEQSPAAADLRRSGLSRVRDWLAMLTLGPDEMAAFSSGARPVTDLRTTLEYPPFSALDPPTWIRNQEELVALRSGAVPLGVLPPALLQDGELVASVKRFSEAKTLLYRAASARDRGDLERAASLLGEARKTNWDDTEIKDAHESVLEELGRARMQKVLAEP
jgi:spermidine synthase